MVRKPAYKILAYRYVVGLECPTNVVGYRQFIGSCIGIRSVVCIGSKLVDWAHPLIILSCKR